MDLLSFLLAFPNDADAHTVDTSNNTSEPTSISLTSRGANENQLQHPLLLPFPRRNGSNRSITSEMHLCSNISFLLILPRLVSICMYLADEGTGGTLDARLGDKVCKKSQEY